MSMISSKNIYENFKLKIKEYKLWKFYEIKTCLFRSNDKEKWKIGFLYVRLIDYKVPIYPIKLNNNQLKIIQEIKSINSLEKLVDNISKGNSVTIGTHRCSLQLISEPPSYELCQRYIMIRQGIDNSCYMLKKSGNLPTKFYELI